MKTKTLSLANSTTVGGEGPSTVLRNGRFLEPNSGEVCEGDMLIAKGKIAGIDDRIEGNSYRTIELAGGTVIPGMIDAHFHAYAASMGGIHMATRTKSFVVLNGAIRLASALRRGFTTVRDVAGGDIGLKQAIDNGSLLAPNYLYSGRVLSQTGGHGDVRTAEHDLHPGCDHTHEVVDGVENLRRATRERLRTGSHAIKIMASGGVISPTDPLSVPQYSAEEIAVVCEEASRRGSYVAAHAYSAEAVIHSVENGVRSIEHGNLIDEPAAKSMARHSAFLVPTLVAYDAMHRRGAEAGLTPVGQAKNLEVLREGKRAIELARAAGVSIGFGTDLMGDLEDEQLAGIRLQSEVLDPLELLQSLTITNAKLVNDEKRGNLRIGSNADIIVLSSNPLDDVSVLWDQNRPRLVMKEGIVVHDER